MIGFIVDFDGIEKFCFSDFLGQRMTDSPGETIPSNIIKFCQDIYKKKRRERINKTFYFWSELILTIKN